MRHTTVRHTTVPSVLGPLTLVADDADALTGVYFEGHHPAPASASLGPYTEPDATLVAAATQIDEYLAGRRQVFDLVVHITGTPFQQSVWTALTQVAYGEQTTYGALAAAVGRPAAARAVGAAVGRNRLSIIVPCHRVVGSAGLTGYAGGLDRKRHLLDLETGTATVV